MPSCVICHMDITKYDVLINCPNDHPVHEVCLKEWISHSKNCPVCSTTYSITITDSFKDYLDKREKDAQAEIEAEKRKKIEEKLEKIAEQIAFKKVLESIEKLAEEKQFDAAVERLVSFDIRNLPPFKLQNVLFLKGKVFYLMGKYDMAINNLFNLVKNHNFEFPDAFLYLGKAYGALGLTDKAKWAYDRAKK